MAPLALKMDDELQRCSLCRKGWGMFSKDEDRAISIEKRGELLKLKDFWAESASAVLKACGETSVEYPTVEFFFDRALTRSLLQVEFYLMPDKQVVTLQQYKTA